VPRLRVLAFGQVGVAGFVGGRPAVLFNKVKSED
jgi:hypothetical protein